MKTMRMRNIPFSLVLVFSVAIGSLLGFCLGDDAKILKPFGDIFLNLLFTLVVPLVFLSISSALANVREVGRAGRTLAWMMLVFVATGVIASLMMIGAIWIFPIHLKINLAADYVANPTSNNLATQLVNAIAVSDFPELWSKKNLLPMIIFAVIIGLSCSILGKKARPFTELLTSGNEVMMQALSLLMWYAPIGLAAYFAYFIGVTGSALLGAYFNAVIIYFCVGSIYFFLGFTVYAYCAGGVLGVRKFWTNIIPAALMAFASGSSVATIPLNIAAARKTGVADDISEIVIPIGATVHMDGSCLSAILKIAILAQVYDLELFGFVPLISAVSIALISSVVMSGIPGGGFLGEAMIVGLYGLPVEAIPLITMIGTLVDAPATAINSIGDNVCSMLVARLRDGKDWMLQKAKSH